MLFAVRVALLLAVLGTTAGAARHDDLSGLFAQMRARSGPVWRTHLISVSHIANGNDMSEVHSESLGLRFSTYECAATLCAGSYFDGERVYSININGTALPSSATPDTFLRGERTIASLAFLARDFSGNIEDTGWETMNGERFRTFSVASGDGTPMHVYVDAATALVRYMRGDDGTVIEYLDYRRVDGHLLLPFLVLRNGSVLERYDSRGRTSDEFTPPRGLVARFDGAPLPVKTDPSRAIPVFPCSIGTVTTNCLLDSGNSGLSISAELAQSLHAPEVGAFVVRGLGNYETRVVRAGVLRVGNASFPPANYVVLRDIHRYGYDVVLGADVLASTTVRLDPVHHTLLLNAAVPANGTKIPLIFQNFVPVVMVRLGTLGTQLALDTGDESNINLAYEFYREHPGLFDATEQRSVSGIGGTSVELIGTIPEVRIGDLSMAQQRIGATQTLRGTAFGHLGAGFLSHFDVVIDYAAQEVHFEPTPTPTPTP